LGLSGEVVGAIDGLGLEIDEMLVMIETLDAFIRSGTLEDLSEQEAVRRATLTQDEWMQTQVPHIASSIESGRHPMVRASSWTPARPTTLIASNTALNWGSSECSTAWPRCFPRSAVRIGVHGSGRRGSCRGRRTAANTLLRSVRKSLSLGSVTTEMMPAAVYIGEGRIAVEEVPRPEPGPGEVLVEIAECGICGSDLHMVMERFASPGAILGHEWSGTVASAPSGSNWSPGDRVVGNPTPGCGVCRPCKRGRPSVCLARASADFGGFRGAFCQYKTVAADGLIRIPDSLPTRVAALAEPMAIALHAVEVGGVSPEDRVLVTGAGPVGLLIIAALRARGVSEITASEPSPVRRQQALDVGATRAVSPDTLGEPPMTAPVAEPFSVIFECSGHGKAIEGAVGQLDYAGTLVIVGTGFQSPRINQNRMILFELEIVGAYNYNDDGFQPAVDLLNSGTLPLDSLIEPDDIPLSQVMDSMERLSRGEIPSKVMVRPSMPS
jgi:2-desacetyl-2-hydroxyethyl bacteriochlorophyllide A dehydrogenase